MFPFPAAFLSRGGESRFLPPPVIIGGRDLAVDEAEFGQDLDRDFDFDFDFDFDVDFDHGEGGGGGGGDDGDVLVEFGMKTLLTIFSIRSIIARFFAKGKSFFLSTTNKSVILVVRENRAGFNLCFTCIIIAPWWL